jgi:hypothetical protein
MSNISAWQHQENVKRLHDLKAQGYDINITSDGYSVSDPTGKYLGGASVLLPRRKPLHWRHRSANMKDFLNTVLVVIDRAKIFDKVDSVN